MKTIQNEKINFSVYFICQIVSKLGSIFQMSITPLFLLDLTNSGAKMGLISGILLFATIFFSYFSGILADKFPPKKILIISDLVSGIILALYLFFIRDQTLLNFFTLMLLLGATGSCFNSANNSVFSRISPELSIQKKNSLINIGINFVGVFGPVLGIAIYSNFGLNTILFINMLSYLISGIIEFFIEIGELEYHKELISHNYYAVISFLKENSVLQDITILTFILNFILTPFFNVVLFYFLKETLKMPSEYIGYSQSLTAVGLLGGSIFVFKMGEKLKIRDNYFFLIFIQSITIFLFYFLLNYVYPSNKILGTIIFAVGLLILFFINSSILIPMNSLLHEKVDNSIKGRFFAFYTNIKQILTPLSIAFYSNFIDRINPVYLIFFAVTISLCMQIYFVKKKKLLSRYPDFCNNIKS